MKGKLLLLLIGLTLMTEATELKRTGWNLIAICQDINKTNIDMTGIEEIQAQNGKTIYTGENAKYTNLDKLDAGYGYWIKGSAGTNFDSGYRIKELKKPLQRDGWNLMASCEDIAQSEISLTNISEIQNQEGKTIYTGDFAKYSNLDSLVNGYGYWVKGDKGVEFTSKRALDVNTTTPTLELNGDSEVTIILGNIYKELGAKAVDSSDKNLTVTIQGDVNSSKIGDYTVEYNAVDSSGSRASKSRTVHIVSPEILVKNLNVQKSSCSHFGSLKINNYTYSNNTWGKNRLYDGEDWIQCSFSYLDENNSLKGGFYWGWPNGKGNVKSYPEVIYGRKFRGQRNPESGWPIKVSDMKEVFVDIAYRDINFIGKYNIAPEWWLHLDKDTSMDNIKYEIMVRLDPDGFHPSHPWIEDVDIDGIVYDVYKDEPWGENNRQFFNFVAHKKVTDIKLHPNAFMNFLYKNGVSDIPDLYYADIEMGVEVINGSGLLLVDKIKVKQANKPIESIKVNQEYSYSPDLNNSSLTYTIANMPDWAEFDEETGRLSGVPNEVKIYSNIEINATNGVQIFQVAKFDLNVSDNQKIINITKFAKATQGSTYGKLDALLAIDDDNTTINHTLCKDGKNWWQLEFPEQSHIDKISVLNRDSWGERLEGAKVYISDTPYNENLSQDYVVHILKGIYDLQTFDIGHKEAKYLIIKAKDANCLHLREVKVYGSVTQTPITEVRIENPQISTEIDQGTIVAKVDATDLQGDSLIYSIKNSVPFSIDSNGTIRVNGNLEEDKIYTIIVEISDGEHVKEVTIEVRTTAKNALTKALRTGNATNVSIDELYRAVEKEESTINPQCNELLSYFYPNGATNNPYKGHADHFITTTIRNTPIFGGYENSKNVYYGFVGEKRNGARYAFLGAPLSTLESSVKDSVTNMFKWLTKDENASNIFNKELTIVVNSGAKSDLENWLNDNSIATSWRVTEDTSLLDSGNFDIYIVRAETTQNYKKAIEAKKAVILYDRPSIEQRDYFNLKYTVWEDTQGVWSSIDDICLDISKSEQSKKDGVVRLLKHLRDSDFDIAYEDDDLNEPKGYDKYSNVSLKDLLFTPINNIKTDLKSLDAQNIDIFDSNQSYDRFLKLVLLIGDKYRANIAYPMDRDTTDDATLFKAYFADSTPLYSRKSVHYQPDLGDFTPKLQEVLEQPTSSEDLTLTPNRYDSWTSTGFYLLPGQTITVKRADDSDNEVKLKINMQRFTSTRMWEPNSYTRPRFLQSNVISIEKGKEYRVSSPYGGPIYVHWRGVKENAKSFTLHFENVAKHPTLIVDSATFPEDKINEYYNKLLDTPFNYTDIKTPFLEVHTLVQLQLDAFNDKHYNGDLKRYFNDLKQYLVKDILEEAGFQGDGLNLYSNVKDWCDEVGLDCESPIHQKPKIQHINADHRAACGAGCSGNPFDITEPLTIFAGAPVHEYGHNLQTILIKPYTWYSTEVTNNVFTNYIASLYAKDHGEMVASYKWNDFPKSYAILNQAIRENIAPHVDTHPMWLNAETHKYADVRQVLVTHIAFLNRDWHVYTKLYLLERTFRDALSSQEKWDNTKDTIGFSNYSLDEAKELLYPPMEKSNDFLAIELSKISNKNYVPYLNTWGLEISNKAIEQIKSNGDDTENIDSEFFVYRDDHDLPVEIPTKTVPIDGVDLDLTEKIEEICSSDNPTDCKDRALVYSFDDTSVKFYSIFSDNGTTDAIVKDEPYTTLQAKTLDEEVVTLHATQVDEDDKTTLIIWIPQEENQNLSDGVINYDEVPYIEVRDGNGKAIKRIKVRVDTDLIKSN